MTPYDLSVVHEDRTAELDTLARLLNERWRPVPPAPDPRVLLIAHAMRLIASALED
jgi:hypothetical protein